MEPASWVSGPCLFDVQVEGAWERRIYRSGLGSWEVETERWRDIRNGGLIDSPAI